MSPMKPAVEVDALTVAYRAGGRDVEVLDEVGFRAARGEVVALVGESGSGKSTAAAALLGHLRHGSRLLGGSVHVDGQDVFALKPAELRRLRARSVALVAQNAGAALTPSLRIGDQVAEAARVAGRPASRSAVVEALDAVRLPNPAELFRRYPHELSGGQQQRVGIAAAIVRRPQVLVLDEPTTGLDVVTQAAILDLLAELTTELDVAAVMVTHDLGVVARSADSAVVLSAGRVVENAPVTELFATPRSDTARSLLASVPRLKSEIAPRATDPEAPVVLDLQGVRLQHGHGRRAHVAVDGVDLTLRRGEILALVGSSGSGKSTIARAVVGLQEFSAGTATSAGEDLTRSARRRPASLRRRVQMVLQNADTSLNPRRTVREAVRRPLRLFGIARGKQAEQRADELLADVRLDVGFGSRLPQQLSGGQRQRVGIARALAGGPDIVVADEITTALDVTVQAEVLQLLRDLRQERDLACLFISHDLAVVRGIADRVAVLDGGRIVEQGPVADVFANPQHATTRALLAAALEPDPGAHR